MIRIEVQEKNGQISRLTVKGHDTSAPAGESLVCAGVSCIMAGGQNALYEQFPGDLKQVNKAGVSEIKVIKSGDNLQRALEFLMFQLATVQEAFPEQIKLNRKEV